MNQTNENTRPEHRMSDLRIPLREFLDRLEAMNRDDTRRIVRTLTAYYCYEPPTAASPTIAALIAEAGQARSQQ